MWCNIPVLNCKTVHVLTQKPYTVHWYDWQGKAESIPMSPTLKTETLPLGHCSGFSVSIVLSYTNRTLLILSQYQRQYLRCEKGKLCMCVYVCMRLHTCVCVYVCVCVCVCVYGCIRTHEGVLDSKEQCVRTWLMHTLADNTETAKSRTVTLKAYRDTTTEANAQHTIESSNCTDDWKRLTFKGHNTVRHWGQMSEVILKDT